MPLFFVPHISEGSIASGPTTYAAVIAHVVELPLAVGIAAKLTRITEEEAAEIRSAATPAAEAVKE